MKKIGLILLGFLVMSASAFSLPNDFIYVKDIAPFITQDIRYATANNFIGYPLTGYQKPICILTKSTVQALIEVQKELNHQGLGLKIFDGYRPQMTVDFFISWAKDAADQKMKSQYYPNVNKADFFKLGYVAEKSGHTRGSTVDLTIINLKTQQEIDMGTHFDFMDPLSHPDNQMITKAQYQNRQLLQQLMVKHGFKPLDTEWWHFTLINEPYPETYFNFIVG